MLFSILKYTKKPLNPVPKYICLNGILERKIYIIFVYINFMKNFQAKRRVHAQGYKLPPKNQIKIPNTLSKNSESIIYYKEFPKI